MVSLPSLFNILCKKKKNNPPDLTETVFETDKEKSPKAPKLCYLAKQAVCPISCSVPREKNAALFFPVLVPAN